ncbi:hypothetical protein AKJ61_01825 [candidate division MSBL1 archaeon SCGC-AAA259B11]|uniref:Uncharacterized protein n=1 Tax=candidate division MSBL1 archaeon SCGC-AAA259B11 TaxID=1698260 RepID=A0A133U6T5_9EURY|nr:hypothetical protein AKJ61_01825 [candidate division MSBL1 archaeon SCGC-AAA259B11]
MVILAAILGAISITSGFIMDYYWFGSVGYLQVFMINIRYQLALLFIGWGITTICLLLILRTVRKSFSEEISGFGETFFKIISVFIGFGIGWWFKGAYLPVLKFLNQASWGVTDPVFNQDISFYVFTLPFLRTILTFIAVVSGIVLVLSFLTYGIGRSQYEARKEEMDISSEGSFWRVSQFLKSWPVRGSIITLTIVGAIFTLLGRYSHLWKFYPGASVPTGASYMAVNYLIPYTWVRVFGVLLFGYLIFHIFSNADKIRESIEFEDFGALRREAIIFVVIILIFLIIPGGVFGAINTLNVQPNEPGIQQPYIERCIDMTNQAYNLQNITETVYPTPENDLTSEEAWRSPTVRNARIVDYRPVKQTYQEKQRLRTYYEFHDVDVDRYSTGEEKQLVVISGREMSKLGGGWQNQHLYYTHGYGAVVSPASRTAPDGSPILEIRDIPPTDWGDISIKDEPRIYFGERTNSYAIVKANGLDEFDYPKGENNVSYRYEYDSGISIGNAWKKLVSWFYTGDFNILVSNYVGQDSKLLLHRNIHDRVAKIAPFLRFDPNGHLFITNNRLTYLLNGITQTERYPYSYSDGEAPGYLSDSVKAFVKANTGEVEFYITEEGDPMVETFSNIYPGLFKDGDDLPTGYREHLIYPQSLFNVQMKIFRRYHMKNYVPFYQREDIWTLAEEKYHGVSKRVEPYNILLDVTDRPGFEPNSEEFTLVQPFTPEDKRNMIAWLGVGQDPGNYGKIIAIKFPKGELFRGPMQVEAITDQDTEISQQFSLWEGAGSKVLRGNLLVLPVEDDILYIEPLYLSAETVAYPQLKRIVVVYRDTAVMENSLRNSVAMVLGEEITPGPTPGDNMAPPELVQVVQRYIELREEYQRLYNRGEYAAAGEIQEQIADLVENMRRLLGS